MGQVEYRIALAGRADEADVEDVRKAFETGVKALRKADVTVEGTLIANEQGDIDGQTGLATPRIDIHDLAGDVK